MRFILAILAFIIATALLAAGIAQRTVFLPPSATTSTVDISGSEQYVIIDDTVLTSKPGTQTVTLTGPSTVFAAYGRTSDVRAWVDGSAFQELTVDSESGDIEANPVAADPEAAPNVASGSSNPAGSDLWLEQYTAENVLVRSVSLPAGYSLIVASDGTAPAPSAISISWPLSNGTPLAGPFLVAGGIALLAGLFLLLLGLRHMKRQRGPRRKPPALPPGKRYSSARRNAIESSTTRGRRAVTRSMSALIPISLGTALLLSGCAPEYWPQAAPEVAATATATPTPTPTPGAVIDAPPPPVVTVQQAESIVAAVAAASAAGDAAGNAELLTPRFSGPAYDIRAASYTIKAKYPEFQAQPAVPGSSPSVILPQATTVWPRNVFTIVQNAGDPNGPSLAMMLQQQSARSNYKAYYVVALEPGTTLPPVASAQVGTARLAPDTKLLTLTPAALKTAYADVLALGNQSASYGIFDTANDSLLTQVGVDNKNSRKAGLPTTATLEFGRVEGTGQNIALATNGSGAITAINIRESETVKPVQAGATVTPEGAVKALSGVGDTTKGVEAVYDYQLLFYIPPKGDPGLVTLLGFSQGLLSAKELP